MSAKRKTSARRTQATPPILDAKTISEFIAAANEEFNLDLPESWPAGTVLANLWALKVEVRKDLDTGSYIATSTLDDYPTIGNGTGMKGRFNAELTNKQKLFLRNAIGADRLSLSDQLQELTNGE